MHAAYDADLVLKVRIGDPLSEECRFAAVTGTAVLFDDVTQRTTFGQLLTCRIIPEEIDLINTLQYVMHEMMHILVRLHFTCCCITTHACQHGRLLQALSNVRVLDTLSPGSMHILADMVSYRHDGSRQRVAEPRCPGLHMLYTAHSCHQLRYLSIHFKLAVIVQGFQMSLYRTFHSVARQEDIVQVLPESERVPASLGTRSVGPEFSIISPNALREARMHFGCPAMDKVLLGNELFGGGPDPPEHWSLRHQNVRATTRSPLHRNGDNGHRSGEHCMRHPPFCADMHANHWHGPWQAHRRKYDVVSD